MIVYMSPTVPAPLSERAGISYALAIRWAYHKLVAAEEK